MRKLEGLRREVHRLRATSSSPARPASLLRPDRMLEALVKHAPMGWACFDRQYRYVQINQSLARINGRPAEEHLGRTLRQIYPEVAQVAEPWIDQVFATGEPVVGHEFVGLRDPDRPIHFLNSFYPILDTDGRVAWVGAFIFDITENRRQQEALKRSEAEFRAVFEQSGVPKLVADPATGRLLRVNPRFCELTGYSPDELAQMTFWGVTHPDERDRDREAFAALVAGTTRQYETEKRCVRKDGRVVWVHENARMVRSVLGVPYCTVAVVQDITVRKAAEEQLRAAKEEAEAARREVEAASRAKDHFLAQLSHELRTPLTPVLMAAQAMEEDPTLPAAVREDVQMIRRNVELEARLIDDLLDLTRIARGKIELHREVCDLHGLLDHALHACIDETVRHKALHIDTRLEAAESFAWADPARIQQVFWNIIKNAIKFTGHGGSITIRSSNPGPDAICIEVSDTGVGIPPENLTAIFTAFEQGGPGITRRFGGLGLGLAICKALVGMHDGRITAHSAGVGQGATFRVELPIVVERESPRTGGESAADSAPTRGERPLRVLLVEDHETTARILERLLTSERYIIRTASTVRAALALAERQPFDLVVSDLGLPDGSGLQLMIQLRRKLPALRGIAVSGYGMDEDLKRSAEAGFERHLVKPVNFQMLREAIDQLAGGGDAVSFDWDRVKAQT